jgi:hypothetical protein
VGRRSVPEREGHLTVPRKHIEVLDDGQAVKLGMFIASTRARKAKLPPERAELNGLGIRWT